MYIKLKLITVCTMMFFIMDNVAIFIIMSWSASKYRWNPFRTRLRWMMILILVYSLSLLALQRSAALRGHQSTSWDYRFFFYERAIMINKNREQHDDDDVDVDDDQAHTTQKKWKQNFVHPEIERVCTASHKMSAVSRSSRSRMVIAMCLKNEGSAFSSCCVFIWVW